MLKTLLWGLAELSPIPTSLLLFARGATAVYHVYRAHRLTGETANESDAHAILDEVRGKIDTLSPEEARHVLDLLLEGHGLR